MFSKNRRALEQMEQDLVPQTKNSFVLDAYSYPRCILITLTTTPPQFTFSLNKRINKSISLPILDPRALGSGVENVPYQEDESSQNVF